MFFILESKKHNLVGSIVYSGDDGFGLSFLKGFIVDPPPEKGQLFVEVESNCIDLPDYIEFDGTPVISQKFVEVLATHSIDNYQIFPVGIHFNDKVLEGHYIFNVIGRISWIDPENSECTKIRSRIMRMKYLKHNDQPTMNIELFRDVAYQEIMFISETLKHSIENSGIEGCTVRPAEGWNDKHRF